MVENLAKALYTALNREEYLPNIEYTHKTIQQRRDGEDGITKYRRPREDDVDIYHFSQTWGSTALGFGGIGGAAMTKAYTTVIILQSKYAVIFFDGRFAYKAKTNNEFYSDLKRFDMASREESEKYLI